MRFQEYLNKIFRQNLTLRISLVSLSLCLMLLCIGFISLSFKAPIIIDRHCISRAIKSAPQSRTNLEIEAFINEALSHRFNTKTTPNQSYLSRKEYLKRLKEQTHLKRQGMSQRVTITDINITDKFIAINSDRIISVGTVRSAFIFPLKILVKKVDRSKSNPYGLILAKIDPIESKKQAK